MRHPTARPWRPFCESVGSVQPSPVAINRQRIIDAVYCGLGEPMALAPEKGTPWYCEKAEKSCIMSLIRTKRTDCSTNLS